MQFVISAFNMVNVIFRSPLCSINNLRNFSTYYHPLHFRATEALLGEPLKKKRRIDPSVLKAREEKRKRKLEKQIRLAEKCSNHLKPIFEIDILPTLINTSERARQTVLQPEEEIERRALLPREWSMYKQDQWRSDIKFIKSLIRSQEIALKELKAVSKQFYKNAVEFDDTYLPYSANGPVRTVPINDYDSPDGDYTETTVKYVGE